MAQRLATHSHYQEVWGSIPTWYMNRRSVNLSFYFTFCQQLLLNNWIVMHYRQFNYKTSSPQIIHYKARPLCSWIFRVCALGWLYFRPKYRLSQYPWNDVDCVLGSTYKIFLVWELVRGAINPDFVVRYFDAAPKIPERSAAGNGKAGFRTRPCFRSSWPSRAAAPSRPKSCSLSSNTW